MQCKQVCLGQAIDFIGSFLEAGSNQVCPNEKRRKRKI